MRETFLSLDSFGAVPQAYFERQPASSRTDGAANKGLPMDEHMYGKLGKEGISVQPVLVVAVDCWVSVFVPCCAVILEDNYPAKPKILRRCASYAISKLHG